MGFKVIKENVLKANADVAGNIRSIMAKERIFMINIISSPGSGKTSLLEKMGPVLKREGVRFLVIAGDCFTSRDAERMDLLGLPVVQVNTGNACHIDAGFIKKSLEGLDLASIDLIIVENVGNLVCPAEFDLGEDAKIAFLSTTEGHDKPAKYPLLIQESQLAIINKIDLLRYVDYDLAVGEQSIREINPRIKVLKISCKTGEGIDAFVKWLKNKIKTKKEPA